NRAAVDANNGQGNPSRRDDIDPNSIERIEVLKGAAAATLYGTEASNGVIQIFTKRGRAGAPRFSAQADWSAISVPTNRMLPIADYIGRDCDEVDCTGADDAATISAIQTRMQDRFGITPGPFEPFQRDLIPEMLSTGFGQTYSASVNGGSDAFQYFVSARLQDEDGPYNPQQNFPVVENLDVETDTNRRATFTSNFTVIPNEKVRIGVSTLYSDMEHHTPDNGNNIYGVFSSILMTQLRRATPQAEVGEEGSNYYGNPAFATTRENMYQQNFVNAQHFAGSANIGFTPTDNFRLDGTFGLDFTSDDAVAFRPYAWNVDGFSGSTPDGSRSVEEYRSREITADVKGSLITNFTDNIENTFLFGGQGFLRQNQEAGGSGSVFPGPGLETLSALANEGSFETWSRVTQLGGYLQDQVGINDWIFITLGGRWDANSAFGEDFSTAFYPKASASIVPSQGLGWSNETFSTVRFRAAIGESGLQPDAFAKFTTYSPAPSEAGPGVEPDNLGNDNLSPEVSREWEVGAEVGLFNDRWSVDATYWDRTVTDALVSRQFSVTGGFVANQLVNIGELVGKGFEVSIRGTAIQREGFSVNVFGNTAWLEEEITSLGGAPPLKTGGSYPRYTNWLAEGFTPGAFFGSTTADLPIPLNLLDPAADGSCVVPTEAEALAYFAQPR
ncbi:MAG: TonB-dependent receptor, partial [Halobacteriales archaeon]|nr:TonB-dependent receptor [Halobacteriales archaeon]